MPPSFRRKPKTFGDVTREEAAKRREQVGNLSGQDLNRARFSSDPATRIAAKNRAGITGTFQRTLSRPTGTPIEQAEDVTSLPTAPASNIRESNAATGREIGRIEQERAQQQATGEAVQITKTPEQIESEERISRSFNDLLSLFSVTGQQARAPENQPKVVGTRQVELTDEFGNTQIVDQPVYAGEFGDPSAETGLLLQGAALAMGAGPGFIAAKTITKGINSAVGLAFRNVFARLGAGSIVTTAGPTTFGGGLLRTALGGYALGKAAGVVSTRASNLETSIVNLREMGSFVQTGVTTGAISKEDGLQFLDTTEQEIDRLYGDMQLLVKVNPTLILEGKDQEILTRYLKAKADLTIRRAAIEQAPIVESDPVEAAFLLNNIQRYSENLG